jgi:hypothetical protein
MTSVESLSHTRWDCMYHLVWVPNTALSGSQFQASGFAGGHSILLAISTGTPEPGA